jgi:2-polyprenyl-6-methoxyphenol hydroxylase-like FAD-dependent oxidoreductase
MNHYDVVIVGGRLAGAATAMLTARAGRRVLVIERARPGSDTLSTHALLRAGTLQLKRFGVLDRIVAAGTPPVRRTTFHHDDGSTPITIKPSAGIDTLYAPRRTLLDRVLVDAARAAGAEIRFGVAATELTRDAHGRADGVVMRDAQGHYERITADLVVGADGAGSFVARAVAAPLERLGHHASAFVFGYWDGVAQDGYEWVYRPGMTAGLIPTNDDQTCIFIGTTPTRFRVEVAPDVPGAYHRLLVAGFPEAHDRLARAGAPARLRTFPGLTGFVRRSHGPGWALVGDAGYFKDPLSAHGMTDALRDAELLARAVLAQDDPADEEALAAYQATRDRCSRALFDVVDRIASYDWDTPTVRELLLELNSSMAEEVELLAGLGPLPGAPLGIAV